MHVFLIMQNIFICNICLEYIIFMYNAVQEKIINLMNIITQ